MKDFIIKRIHSLLGIFPIGAFLVQHFFSNSYALISPEAFNEHSAFLVSLPLVVLIELGVIYLPILAHIIFGFIIIYKGRNNVTHYGYFRNWMYFAQRVTGILATIFVVTHTYTTRISHFIHGETFTFNDMATTLQDPFWFWFYAVGMVSVTFHFCNGIWSFLITWGITVSQKAQRAVSALTMAAFVLMTVWGFVFMNAFLS